MEARKLKTIDDPLVCPEERVDLICGAIVRRPIARSEHGLVEGSTRAELSPFTRASGPGGWWIITEVSVAYEVHQCPVYDLAGRWKERVPERPKGIKETTPDWVCEIVSPGRERKDTFDVLLLQRHRVPYYWIILARGSGPGRPSTGWRGLSRHRDPFRRDDSQGPALRRHRARPRLHPRRLADETRVLPGAQASCWQLGSPASDPQGRGSPRRR